MAVSNQNISSPTLTPTGHINLRHYQKSGVESLQKLSQSKVKRVLFFLATGGGKTMVFVYQMAKAYQEGRRAKLSLRRRALIFQTSKILTALGVPHGIVMAGEKEGPNELIQICSIDTEYSRNYFIFSDDPTADVHIDECHDCNPKGVKYRNFFNAYDKHNIVGYSASPFGDNSFFEAVVSPISASDLRDEGYLVKEKVFAPPKGLIDTSSVETVAGEYNLKQLSDVSSTNKMIGGFVHNWREINKEERPTILFAVTKTHSRAICEAFNRAGIKAGHLDCDDSQENRDQIIEDLRSGKIKVVCNVDLFTVGVDFPEVGCIQLCRPTMSLIWHVQSVGRGLRPYKNKEHLSVIDHAGNYAEHGSVFEPREISLDALPLRSNRPAMVFCEMCGFLFEDNTEEKCPSCGHVKEKVTKNVAHTIIDDGVLLEEISFKEKRKKVYPEVNKMDFVAEFIKFSNIRNKKRIRQAGWEYRQLVEKYGVDQCLSLKESVPRFPPHLLTINIK